MKRFGTLFFVLCPRILTEIFYLDFIYFVRYGVHPLSSSDIESGKYEYTFPCFRVPHERVTIRRKKKSGRVTFLSCLPSSLHHAVASAAMK